MFGDVNSVTLIGNITNDINVKYTPNGRAIANFGVAVNRSYRLPDSTEWKDEATFLNVVLFGNTVDSFSQRAHKGTRVYVLGRIQNRSWQDKEGKTQYRTEIVADRVILLDRYEKGPGMGGAPKAEQPAEDYPTTAQSAPKSSAKPAKPQDDTVIDVDDLPF